MTDQLPPPPPSYLPAPPEVPRSPKPGRRGRPAFGAVIAATIGFRVFRDVIGRAAFSTWGVLGAVAVTAAGIAFVLLWRAQQRQRAKTRGGELTPEIVAKQLDESGLLPPAFAGDGTILGTSILVVDQLPKVLEVETAYELFGADAQPIGTIRQVGQSQLKRFFRVITAFDQFFTHHFEVEDLAGRDVLRLSRPAKAFRSRVHVFDGADRFIGTIRQENVFWKIRFQLIDPAGNVAGWLRAANVRAWDFHVEDVHGREIATIVKSWEGWGRTAFTRSDRYVLRIHEPLPYGLRELVLATPLTIDVALKQDARGFG